MDKELYNMTEIEIKELLNEIAEFINSKTNSLFMLVLFDEPNLAQYISNAKKEDCIKAMEETAQRFKNNQILERN